MSKPQQEWFTPAAAPLPRSYEAVAVSQYIEIFKNTLSQLGVDYDDYFEKSDEWVISHRKPIREAWTLAKSNSEKNIQRSEKMKSIPFAIDIDTKVILRIINKVETGCKMHKSQSLPLLLESYELCVQGKVSGEIKVLHRKRNFRYQRIFPRRWKH